MPRTRELPARYPQHPTRLGEHVRKARVDRGLTREPLAARFQVRPGTIRAWECGSSQPAVRLIPAVLAFLGYDVDSPEGSIWERVRWKRRRLGLSEAALGRLLGLAPSTFFRGECGMRTTSAQTLEKLNEFLDRPEDGDLPPGG